MKAQLSVFHLLDGRFHCGASLVTRTLIQSLRAADVDAKLVCLYEGAVAAAARSEGLDPVVLPSSGTALARLHALRKMIDPAPDARSILHSHQLRANRFASLAAALARIPHVITIHTHKEELLREYFPNPAKRAIMRTLHYWTLDRAAARIAVSPGILQTLLARGYAPDRTQLIRNITNIPEPCEDVKAIRSAVREELGVPEKTVLLLAAGRMVPVKQFETLLQAIPLMKGPPLDQAIVLFAGDGHRRQALEQHAHDLGISHRTRFLGWRTDLQRLILASDCAISTSRSECSPVFLIEAMSLARPVVAADAVDVAALVRDREQGLLFSVGSPEALVDRLAFLMKNRERGHQLGKAARLHIQTLFDTDRTISDIVGLYKTVLQSPHGT
jgi:glycosyltransferase involved in cell wall biosynthesis